jgi:putative ABC transport system permease protein
MLMSSIDSTYLPTAGTRLITGRNISADTATHEAIVTETTARRIWRGEPALGKRFRISREAPMLTVVGIVEDQRGHDGRIVGDSLHLFLQGARLDEEPAITVRVRGGASAALQEIKRVITQGAPQLRVIEAATIRQTVDDARAPQRFTRLVLIGFASCALLLAVIGLYGVMSYGVAQRTHEIGVRMALGAGRRDIRRLVLGEGLGITVAGILAGCAGSLALRRLLDGMLLQVSARDPGAFIAASALVVAAATLALWMPTRRALGVDPIKAVNAA